METLNRRHILKCTAGLGAGLILPECREATANPAGPAEGAAAAKRALRVAHMTDIHIFNENNSAAGVAAAFDHVHQLADRPDMILHGGDAVHCVFWFPQLADMQGELWRRAFDKHCTLPTFHCIGNHDVYGWGKGDFTSANAGKNWAMKLFGLTQPYYSFDRAGWHFIVLDDTHQSGTGFICKLDDEQMKWLKADLAATDPATPVLILSHAPIFSVTPFTEPNSLKADGWHVPNFWMHVDTVELTQLFKQHPNVRVCLSGHAHQVDYCEVNGVAYICSGAVCANKWRGPWVDCETGYGLVDLFEDGSFEYRYVDFGWVAAAEPPDRQRMDYSRSIYRSSKAVVNNP